MKNGQDAPDAPRLTHIPLSHKRVPTEMLPSNEHDLLIYAALVGEWDITTLRAHLVSLPNAHWQDKYNRNHNVHFQRPFHDKLGVENIMCVFSDTQLENVYELPLYAKYRPWVEPIFELMGVEPQQIVRCLFARMPGETLIPPHHDNGRWVSQTHRIHVPIVTFSEIEFKCGGSVETMIRYAFNEGSIVELNNAAKHSVWNPTSQHRIHLIFDYVEKETVVRRTQLSVGQLCRQVRGRVELVDAIDDQAQNQARRSATRLLSALESTVSQHISPEAAQKMVTACRSYFIEQIDARQFVTSIQSILYTQTAELKKQIWEKLIEMFSFVDANSKTELEQARSIPISKPPHWVIIGAQKCGTTSLYQYLSQHPQLLTGKRREPHFFDWNWTTALQRQLSPEEHAIYHKVLSAYETAASQSNASSGSNSEGIPLEDMRAKYLASLQCDDAATAMVPPVQIGESTPSYLLYGMIVARRMKMLYPDMRLIIMLRDPVKRAFSHFQMTADTTGTPAQLKMRAPAQGRSFEELIEEDMILLSAARVSPTGSQRDLDAFQTYANSLSQRHGSHSYIGRGLYFLQISLWLRVFSRDQMLFIDLDDMKNRDGTLQQVNRAFEFLNVNPFNVQDTERKNTRDYDPIDDKTAQKLREFYAPYNEQLFALIGRRFNW